MINKLEQIKNEARNCNASDLRHVVQKLVDILIEEKQAKEEVKEIKKVEIIQQNKSVKKKS